MIIVKNQREGRQDGGKCYWNGVTTKASANLMGVPGAGITLHTSAPTNWSVQGVPGQAGNHGRGRSHQLMAMPRESSDTKTASSWGNLPAPRRASLSSVPTSPAAVHPRDEQIRWFFLASSGRGSPRNLLHFYSCKTKKTNWTTYSPTAAADLKPTLIMTVIPLV